MKTLKKLLSLILLLFTTFHLSYSQNLIIGDSVVCEGSSKSYFTNVGLNYSYTWSATKGASSLPTNDTTHITWGGSGMGIVRVIIDTTNGVNIDTLYLNVIINPKPTPKIYADKTYGCTEIDENGNSVPINANCLTICDSTWVTYTTKLNAGSTYFWQISGTYLNNPILTGNSISIQWGAAGMGNLRVIEMNADSCIGDYETCISVIKRPNAFFTVTPGSMFQPHVLCLGSEVSFFDKSSGAINWYWDFDDPISGSANFSHKKNPKHKFNDPGPKNVRLVVENECHCTDTFYYQFDVIPDPAYEIFCDGVVCEDGTVEYFTTNQYCTNYQWSVSSNGIIVTPSPWWYKIKVLWVSGPIGTVSLWSNCANTSCNDTVSITVPVIPSTINIEGDKRVCINEPSKLWIKCLPGAELKWDPHYSPPKSNPLGDDFYKEHYYEWHTLGVDTVKINYYNPLLLCGGSGITTVNVLNKFVVNGPKIACLNNISSYTPSTNPSGNYDWLIVDSTGAVVTFQPSNSGVFSTPPWPWAGDFKIITINTSGSYCNDTVESLIRVFPKPPVPNPIVGDTLICPGNTSAFYSLPTHAAYYLEWHALNGITTPAYGTNPSFKWNSNGPYSVHVVQQFKQAPNCPSDTVSLNLTPKIPNPFTSIIGNQTPCNNALESYSTPDFGDDYFWEILPQTMGSVVNGQYTDNIDVQWNNSSGSVVLRLHLTVCDSTLIVDSTINLGTGPVLAISPTLPATFCSGSNPGFAATLGGSSSGNFSWYVDGILVGSNSVLSYNFPVAGTHSIKVIGQATGCNANQNITGLVTVEPSPVALVTQQYKYAKICIPDSIFEVLHLSMQNGNSITWTPGGGTGQGTSTYTPHPTTYGTYYANVTGANGCSTTSNSIVLGDSCKIKPKCTRDTSLIWNGATVTETCGAISLTASFSGAVHSYGWGLGTSNNLSHNAQVSQAGYHPFTFSYIVINGLDTCRFDDVEIVRVPLIADFDFGFSCAGGNQFALSFKDRSTYLAPATLSYTWRVGGVIFSSLPNPTVNWTAGTTYTVELTVNNGSNTCTKTKTVVVPSTLSSSFTIAPSATCEGTPVQFISTSTGSISSYFWDFDDMAQLKGNASPQRTYAHTGGSNSFAFYPSLIITGNYGCTDTSSGSVNIYKNNVRDTSNILQWIPAGPNKFLRFCTGQSGQIGIGLRSNPPTWNFPLTYDWSNSFSQSGNIISSSQFVTQSGNYSVEVTDNYGCYGKHGSIGVAVVEVPKPIIFGDHDVCFGTHIFDANVGSTYSYLWRLNGSVLPGASPFTSISFNINPGVYWLQVEVSQFGSTCTNMSDSFKITVHAPPAKPTLYANPSPGCENQSPVTLAAYNVAGYPISVQWSNGAIGDSTNVNTKGVYVATVVDSFGCTNEASIEVYGVPEMCYFMCGCYEFCDTAQGGIWLPGIPGNYASWAWYANGWGAFSSGSGIIQPLDLIAVGGGEVYLVVTNNQGCTDTSCLFEYTLIPCEYSEPMEPCGGDWYGEKVECIDNSPYNYTYILSFNYNWSGCNGSMITNVSSNFGSTSGFSGGMLNSGANSLSGFITFNTPFPPIGQVCLTFTVWDPCTNMHCTFQVCFEDWDCDQMIAPDEVIRIKNAFELPHSKNPDDSNQDQGDNDLRIFPNPTNGLVNLWYRCQNESGCKIEIQNNQGVTIRRVDLPNSSSEIIFNENEFPAGAYSFHLYDGHKHLLQKVIIMK